MSEPAGDVDDGADELVEAPAWVRSFVAAAAAAAVNLGLEPGDFGTWDIGAVAAGRAGGSW